MKISGVDIFASSIGVGILTYGGISGAPTEQVFGAIGSLGIVYFFIKLFSD